MIWKKDYLWIPFVIAALIAGFLFCWLMIELKDSERIEVQHKTEVQRLENRIAQLESEEGTGTGGAEVPLANWTFPILEEEYIRLTSPFGPRVSPLLNIEMDHQGLDIGGIWRARVVAVADGTVVEHWPPPDGYWRGHDTYGGMILIEHEGGFQSLYAHMSETRVHTGDVIKAGEVIGRIGDTGKSDGEHLHLEIRDPTGEVANPLAYVRQPR